MHCRTSLVRCYNYLVQRLQVAHICVSTYNLTILQTWPTKFISQKCVRGQLQLCGRLSLSPHRISSFINKSTEHSGNCNGRQNFIECEGHQALANVAFLDMASMHNLSHKLTVTHVCSLSTTQPVPLGIFGQAQFCSIPGSQFNPVGSGVSMIGHAGSCRYIYSKVHVNVGQTSCRGVGQGSCRALIVWSQLWCTVLRLHAMIKINRCYS